MTIYFNGHDYKYELEAVIKLFVPCRTFDMRYNEPCAESEYIFTEKKMHGENAILTVDIRLLDESFIQSMTVMDQDNNCEMTFAVMLYNGLSKIFDCYPEWGVLTGIRPVALMERLRKEGKSDEEITKYLMEDCLVSQQKVDLGFSILKNQQEITANNHLNDYSLYIGIPFCPSRCSYCSFVSHSIETPKARKLIQPYVDLLVQEIEEASKSAKEMGLNLRTVYIGGGTPTAVSAEQLKQITDAVQKYFHPQEEYTIEAGRADSITRAKLEVIKNSGCTRISVNPQTFSDTVLQAIGRKHTAQDAIDCYKMACEMGFDNINMDFIAGLPSDTVESFSNTIDTAIALNPTNITIHTLSLKRSSTLYQEVRNKELRKHEITPAAQMVKYAQENLLKAGYQPYYLYRQKNMLDNLENVGYAKPGFYNAYNIYIMEEVHSILALGAGGVSKLVFPGGRIERSFNFKYPYEYIDRFDEVLQRKRDLIPLWKEGIRAEEDCL